MANESVKSQTLMTIDIPFEGNVVKCSVGMKEVADKSTCTKDPDWHLMDFETGKISEKSYDIDSLEGLREAEMDKILNLDVSTLATKEDCKKTLERLRAVIRYIQTEKASTRNSMEKLLYESQEKDLRDKRMAVRRRLFDINKAKDNPKQKT